LDGHEIKSTQDFGFRTCKVIEKSTGQVIGLFNVRFGSETYLSLVMIHRSYVRKEIGRQVYAALEVYAGSHESRSIRIDVVKGYDDRVLDFWVRKGFQFVEDIALEWNGSSLPAVAMKKSLAITASGR